MKQQELNLGKKNQVNSKEETAPEVIEEDNEVIEEDCEVIEENTKVSEEQSKHKVSEHVQHN